MKTAIVTGASRGIGKAIATTLAEQGYRLALGCKQNLSQVEKLADQITANGGYAIALQYDVSNEESASAFVAHAQKAFGKIDLLINCAGVAHYGLLQDMTAAQWRNVISTNLDSVFFVTHALLPSMIAQKSGCIINISSICGIVGASCEVAYSASKAGVIGFSKALAKEVAPSGIRVNCIAPGATKTDMLYDLLSSLDTGALEEIIQSTPLARLGEPNEIAQAVLYLARAEFVTGQVLVVDGGFAGV